MRWPCAPWPLLAVAFFGCASSGGLEDEVSRLRREVHDVRAELDETKQQIDRLSGELSLMRPGQIEAARGEGAPKAHALPVVRLRPPAQKAPAKPEDFELGATDDGSPPVLIKVGPGGADEKLAVDREVLKRPDPVLAAGSPAAKAGTKQEIEAAYLGALSTLREAKKPGQAKDLFEGFLERYPRSDLADNAAFWLGECSFVQGQHRSAIQEFQELIEQHPTSPKIPDALLRVGQSWIKLGEPQRAKQSLEKVRSGYPGTAAAEEAELALRGLDGQKG